MILGIVLIFASAGIDTAASAMTLNTDLARANKGIYTIGVILSTVSVSLLALEYENTNARAPLVLMALIIALGLTLIALSAVVINKGNSGAKKWAAGVLVIGIALVVGAGANMVMKKDSLFRYGCGDMSFACY